MWSIFTKGVSSGCALKSITCCCSVAQSCLTLCDPWTAAGQASPSGLTISWSLLKLILWVNDAIQPSHHILPPSPPALSLSKNQGLSQWVSCSHQVTKVMELQLHCQSFQWIFRVDILWVWLYWSPYCPRDSQLSSPAPQFKSINSLVLSLLYGQTLTSICKYWRNHSFNYTDLFRQSYVSTFFFHLFLLVGG